MTRRILLAAGVLVCALAAAGDGPVVKFEDVTTSSGIAFRHTFGDRHFSRILKATGSGVGILDYDGDGDLDLYFVNGKYLPEICDEAGKVNETATNRLYRNDGKHPETGRLRFTDVTDAAGVGDTGYGMGALVADYDNDGDTDLYVTNYGPNVLYRNNGNGTFTDVTEKAGVAGPEKLNGRVKWSTNAVFFDYDRDGWLDLWVCNYLAFDPAFDDYYGPDGFPGPRIYRGQPSMLYRNEGDGTFKDVTEAVGIFRPEGKGMGASAGDVNGDGWPDVYEANDAVPNFLFLNRGGKKFEECAAETLCASGQGGENTAAMHGVMGDVNNDGRLDILVPDMNYFSLFRNEFVNGEGYFEPVGKRSGIAASVGRFTGWGGCFLDYDNDGNLDIFSANGHAHRPENQQNLMLRNLGGGKFVDVGRSLGRSLYFEKRLSRGAAAADLDNDGDLDLAIVNIDINGAGGREGLPTIYLNEGGNQNGWVQVRLIGTRSNRDGIGAKVYVTAGGRTWFDEARSSPSYLSSTEARLHFGIGAAKKIDRLEIVWPSGVRQVLENREANRLHTITEKAASKGGAKEGGE